VYIELISQYTSGHFYPCTWKNNHDIVYLRTIGNLNAQVFDFVGINFWQLVFFAADFADVMI